MSTEDTPSAVRHILLALESAPDIGALELAARLAILMQGSLQGVFVENADLLRAAQLPFAREISLTSAMVRRLETAQLERDLRVQAEQVRRLLQDFALRHSVEWSFRIERGALASALVTSGATDIVILSRSGPRAPRGSIAPVLAGFDGSDSARRALDTAAGMADSVDDLLVLLPIAQADELRQAAAAQLAAGNRRAHYRALPDLSPAQISAASRRHHCRLLVMGGNAAALLPLLQQSSCPVAVVQ
jgi:hypothetical protein